MAYWLFTPESGAAQALVVQLHGCSQTASDYKTRGNWEAAAEQYHLAVALPDVPGGGVILGCWDYYGSNHTVSNRHNGPVIQLTEALRKDLGLEHSYVAGLSSGAGEAMVLGCLRPDLFEGVGLAASPAVGTESKDIYWPRISAEEVAESCRNFSGGRPFAKQKMALVHGDQDFIVNLRHAALIQEAITEIYSAPAASSFDLSLLPGTYSVGEGHRYRDASGQTRFVELTNTGLGHAWPAGNGSGIAQKYINPQSIDYPMFLGEFFTRGF